MSMSMKAMAAGAGAVMLAATAGAAQAQPGYGYEGYGQAPPSPPYHEVGGAGPTACGRDNFTLLGAHAGVTVLGLDLGASAHLGVPVEGDCSQGYAQPAFVPRPYAPPEPPQGYGPPPTYYAPPAPAPVYIPEPQAPPIWGYGAPCGCGASGGW